MNTDKKGAVMIHYIRFKFSDGSNDYISFNTATFWEMLISHNLLQTGERSFLVTGCQKWRKTYKQERAILRDFAIDWQYVANLCSYSYLDLAFWGDFFETYGRRYGLLTEFRENGII